MGCCMSNLKLALPAHFVADGSSYLPTGVFKRSRCGSNSSGNTHNGNTHSSNTGSSNIGHSNGSCGSNSSGLGSECNSTPRNRSIWSRSQTRPICDDFAEQPLSTAQELERSCGYYTSSSAASTPTKQQLRRTQDMDELEQSQRSQHSQHSNQSSELQPAVGNLEWEMYMMQHAQRIMPKTSSPIMLRRDVSFELNSKSYHKWRNYLQSTPAHMLHNVSHIPEAIAGHFCPTDFPAFSDLEEMESAAKRYKVDKDTQSYTHNYPQLQQQQQQHLTHTISTDL